MQKFREIIVILKEGIKHFFLILSQQQEEFFLSHLTLEELRLCHRPEHSMRQDNTILRGIIVKKTILLRRPRFMQFLFHITEPLLPLLPQFRICLYHISRTHLKTNKEPYPYWSSYLDKLAKLESLITNSSMTRLSSLLSISSPLRNKQVATELPYSFQKRDHQAIASLIHLTI